MNRAARRAAASGRRRTRGLHPIEVMAALRSPASPVVVSVSVPERFRAHFDAAVDLVSRLGPEQLEGREVIVDMQDGRIAVMDRALVVERLRADGEHDLAETTAAPAPGGRTRIMLFGDGEVQTYGFRWGALAPGGDA